MISRAVPNLRGLLISAPARNSGTKAGGNIEKKGRKIAGMIVGAVVLEQKMKVDQGLGTAMDRLDAVKTQPIAGLLFEARSCNARVFPLPTLSEVTCS